MMCLKRLFGRDLSHKEKKYFLFHMIVAGFNRCNQLIEKSNNKNSYGYPIIIPPKKSQLDENSLLSFSTYSQHSVWITKDQKAFAIGDNIDGRISNILPKN